MKKRVLTVAIAVTIIVIAVVFVKIISASKGEGKDNVSAKEGMLVNVIYPKLETIENDYNGTGKIRAVDRFEIVAQVDGQLLPSARYFKEGKSYKKGEVILEIDHNEFYMSLLAKKSDFVTLVTSILPDLKSDYPDSYPVWKKYISGINVNKKLPAMPEPQSGQERFFLSGKGILSSYYNVKSGEEKLDKYIIRAPFSGIVTSVSAEAGKAVRPGTGLGTFISTSQYDLEITIPLSAMEQINVGTTALLRSSEISGQWNGKVVRISGDLDEKSQSVKVFIRTSGGNLKEGMYLRAGIKQQQLDDAMKIPRKMIDDNNRLFIVVNNKLKSRQVHVLTRSGDYAIIKGLDEGIPVLSTVVKSAYDGMPVRINKVKTTK